MRFQPGRSRPYRCGGRTAGTDVNGPLSPSLPVAETPHRSREHRYREEAEEKLRRPQRVCGEGYGAVSDGGFRHVSCARYAVERQIGVGVHRL